MTFRKRSVTDYWVWTGALIVVLGISFSDSSTVLAEERFEYSQRQMGVPFTIVLYGSDEAAANAAVTAAFARIKELNQSFSDYEPDSELMRLCKTHGEPISVSDELFDVLSQSQRLSKQTDGAFDVSVGTVVRLWRQARRVRKLPPSDDLQSALELVDYRQIKLNAKAQAVTLGRAGMRLDLGGIAKGYAADAALAVLKEEGFPRAFVDGSGDISFGEPPPGKEGWRIGIAPLTAPDAAPSKFVSLRNAAIATSGDAWQFVEVDGKRYSHIVDPRTGIGLTERSSVTIIAPNGATADSLATAVSVLGPEAGLKLVEDNRKTAAFVVRIEEETPRTFESARLANFVVAD